MIKRYYHNVRGETDMSRDPVKIILERAREAFLNGYH